LDQAPTGDAVLAVPPSGLPVLKKAATSDVRYRPFR